MSNLENLVLLQINIIYFENKFNSGKVPLRKYFYWELLQNLYKLRRNNEINRN